MEQRYRGILRKYWGYEDFRPQQLEVIESVASGWDTLALMPTGAGKSILYQVPAMAREGVCLVVSPLIALMKDQVDRLRALQIPAAAIHSSLTKRQIDIILDNASWGDLKFLYVAPERLSSPVFIERVARMTVNLVAVDEAHCISQWGYDFRPSYLNIGRLREILPGVPVLALTASATPSVAEDIMRHLGMKQGRVVRSSFARPNISYAVRDTDDKAGQLLRILGNVAGAAIVYVRLREEAEKTASMLVENGIGAAAYHAGMDMKSRALKQEEWLRGNIRVMVCTNAFGMGIDKADVRLVVHYDMTDSPESYYQESGRAGRAGRRSFAVLLSG
ncbi:MAG: ATP-dependent DNA helicase, partial [Rikenellaceae bacterium]|nr:ATP-dependent DNA helicase [Rikenellaceae bacterium]